ncbi:PE-PPE domain-containing protein [Mycolicibacterium phlei]
MNARSIATSVIATLSVFWLAAVSTVSPPVRLSADTTALIMCGTTCPTPDDTVVGIARDQYIAPTHPGPIDYVKVTTPEVFWPVTGLFRLIGLVLGDQRLFGPGGPAWPDEPWWKLTGLFDMTVTQSVSIGAENLEAALADNPNDHHVIFGVSQGAGVANFVKGRLAEQYPKGTEGPVPDIDFVLVGDPNLPNGGLASRFPGLYIPILDMRFNGPAPTDTLFDTVEIFRKYDGFTDFPLYPLNVVALLNAVLGVLYVHTNIFDVSLPEDPTTSPAYRGTYGDTSYYFFDTPDLPLFGPLRTLGVPEAVIDVFEPFFREIVELGYDRSIDPWVPTPARLLPTVDPIRVTHDLLRAVGEGANNALKLVGLQPQPTKSVPQQGTAEVVDTPDVDPPTARSTGVQARTVPKPFDDNESDEDEDMDAPQDTAGDTETSESMLGSLRPGMRFSPHDMSLGGRRFRDRAIVSDDLMEQPTDSSQDDLGDESTESGQQTPDAPDAADGADSSTSSA